MVTTSHIPFILPGLAVTQAVLNESELLLDLQSVEASAPCPQCGTASQRFHSSCQRPVQDTPVGRISLRLQIRVWRFRCGNETCTQKTFAEQFADLVGRRQQRTKRLMHNLKNIAVARDSRLGIYRGSHSGELMDASK
jgi:transposase